MSVRSRTRCTTFSLSLEVKTYSGEPHCFAFAGTPPRTPRPEVALRAFEDAHSFFQRHVVTEPRPIDAKLVTHVVIEPPRAR